MLLLLLHENISGQQLQELNLSLITDEMTIREKTIFSSWWVTKVQVLYKVFMYIQGEFLKSEIACKVK